MSLGLVSRVWSGWRRVLGIADLGIGDEGLVALLVRVAAGALASGSFFEAALVQNRSGLLSVALLGIADQGVVSVAPCHWDC